MIALAGLALAAATAPVPPPPTAEAIALGKQLASIGTLATLAPMKMSAEIEEIIAANPDLTDADKAAFRKSAKTTSNRLQAKVIEAEGTAYAQSLSLVDLRTLVAFSATGAAKRQRAAMPVIVLQTVRGIGTVDFKAEAARDFCTVSGKLCATSK